MNIRIGNDILMKVEISNIGNQYTKSDILKIEGIFTHIPEKEECVPSTYVALTRTACGSRSPIYNVLPCNGGHMNHRHSCYVHKTTSPDYTEDGKFVYLTFPGKHQHECGLYSFIVVVTLTKEHNNEQITIDFGPQFMLTHCTNSLFGVTEIPVYKKSDIDLYVCVNTLQYLINANGDYVQMALDSDQYAYNKINNTDIMVHVNGAHNRVIIFTPYDDILAKYNYFTFPFIMAKSKDMYVYVSAYEYSNVDIPIQITRTGRSNTVDNTILGGLINS